MQVERIGDTALHDGKSVGPQNTTHLPVRCVNVSLSPSLQDIRIIKAGTTNYPNLNRNNKVVNKHCNY